MTDTAAHTDPGTNAAVQRALAVLATLLVLACGSTGSSPPARGGSGGQGGTSAGTGGAGGIAGGAGSAPAGAPGFGGAASDTGADAATDVGSAGAGAAAGAGGEAGATGSAEPCDPSLTLPPGDHEFTIKSKNGRTYKYTLVMPNTIAPGTRAPLAIVWHALWSSPEETRARTHIDATMAANGVISVHPRSPDTSWDVGTCCIQYVAGLPRDETVFAKELIAEVESKVCVDTHRVYTAGFSNGGMLSQMLACKMADVFAAAAPMASTLTILPSACKPSRPIPMYMINGTADPLVGYTVPTFSGGVPVPTTFTTWADRDACTDQPHTTLQQGQATCKTYDQCGGGADVTLCTVQGMGHCMPGMKADSPLNCMTKNLIPLGPPNNDIDGIDLAVKFLLAHSLP